MGYVRSLGSGRLIPAHAGKTPEIPRYLAVISAHPRSRGENYSELGNTPSMTGSSPLTRGKHEKSYLVPLVPGLIPAHAGKTHM